MDRVLAVGVFDVIEPGHLAYLEASAALGDELVVLVLRDEAVDPSPLLSAESRAALVDAFRVVDTAVLQPHGRFVEFLAELAPAALAIDRVHGVEPTVLESRLSDIGVQELTVMSVGESDREPSPVRRESEADVGRALLGTEPRET